MKLVRLFVLQDNCRSFLDVPYGEHTEIQADLELQGANVYHAALLSSPPKRKRRWSEATLRQKMY